MKFRVFIVDDNSLVREGLRGFLNNDHELSVCGEAANPETALKKIAALNPDIALIDLSLHGSDMDGLALIRRLKSQNAEMPVLVLSAHEESVFASYAIRAGAQGYVMKQNARKQLLGAIHQVLDGKTYLNQGLKFS